VVLTADLANWTDVVPFAEQFPDRFFNLGMAEQNLVGVGAGLARGGAYPVIVTYGVFATRRAYDQVAMGLCTGAVSALLVGFLPGISSQFKATHQAIDDVALMRALPGMTVLDPVDSTELEALTLASAERGGPCYLRASRGAVPTVLRDPGRIGIGAAVTLREGADAAIVSSGIGSRWALEAASELAGTYRVEAAVVHFNTLKPLDEDAVVEIAGQHEVLHCVENHSSIGGLTSAVSEVVARRGLGVRVVSSAIPDRWGEYGRIDYNRARLGLDRRAIAQRSLDAAGRR